MHPTSGAPVGRISPSLDRALSASTLPFRREPDPLDSEWIPTTKLLDPATWGDLGARYSAHRGLPHLAPGLVCALQHYAGRALQVMVALWCADGSLLDPDHRRWWARIDASGAAREVAAPGLAVLGRDHDPDALAAVLLAHVDPLISACTDAGNATRRLATGCVAASCAGAFALGFRSVEPAGRERIEAASRQVLGHFRPDGDRPTATMVRLDDPDALTHDRHTCCLIRLGPGSGECGTCPRLAEQERRTRQRAAAGRPRTHIDLTLAGGA